MRFIRIIPPVPAIGDYFILLLLIGSISCGLYYSCEKQTVTNSYHTKKAIKKAAL